MAENFYIRFSTAAQWEGNKHSRLVEPRERVDALLPLLFQLIQSDVVPGKNHTCPICSKVLGVSFSRYPRIAKEIGITTYCESCNIIVVFKSNKIPSWISQLPSLFDEIRK